MAIGHRVEYLKV